MKTYLILVIVLVCIMMVLSACEGLNGNLSDLTGETANIYGKVIYPEGMGSGLIRFRSMNLAKMNLEPANVDNNAIARTRVYLDGDKSTATDLEGNFVFHDVSPGTYTLKVESAYFYSEEYEVIVTEDGVMGLELEAEIGGFELESHYDDSNNEMFLSNDGSNETHSLLLHPIFDWSNIETESGPVPLADADESLSIVLEYLQEGIYTEIYNDIPPRRAIEVSDFFDLDIEYELRLTVKEGDTILQQFNKTITFIKPELYSPDNDTIITESNPSFSWEELDGVVIYDFYLEVYNEADDYWSRVRLMNRYDLLASEYTLEFGIDEGLEDGRRYRWSVEAYLLDSTGYPPFPYAYFGSDYREFTYSDPGIDK